MRYFTDEMDFTIIHGDCPSGVDRMASMIITQVSFNLGISVIEEKHPADWERYGKSAGPRRNGEMVKLGADMCLAFLTNESRGGAMTAKMAERAGILTRRFYA